MNRRSFFGTVFGGVAAAVVAPFLPKRVLPVFSGVDLATDADTGISLRYIRQWAPIEHRWITRIDRLEGMAPNEFIKSVDYSAEEFRERYVIPAGKALGRQAAEHDAAILSKLMGQ